MSNGNSPIGCIVAAIILIGSFIGLTAAFGGLGIGIFFGLWIILSFLANKYG